MQASLRFEVMRYIIDNKVICDTESFPSNLLQDFKRESKWYRFGDPIYPHVTRLSIDIYPDEGKHLLRRVYASANSEEYDIEESFRIVGYVVKHIISCRESRRYIYFRLLHKIWSKIDQKYSQLILVKVSRIPLFLDNCTDHWTCILY